MEMEVSDGSDEEDMVDMAVLQRKKERLKFLDP
jgi:hypothetical protein